MSRKAEQLELGQPAEPTEHTPSAEDWPIEREVDLEQAGNPDMLAAIEEIRRLRQSRCDLAAEQGDLESRAHHAEANANWWEAECRDWQRWGALLIERRGLKPACGTHGDAEARKLLEDLFGEERAA